MIKKFRFRRFLWRKIYQKVLKDDYADAWIVYQSIAMMSKMTVGGGCRPFKWEHFLSIDILFALLQFSWITELKKPSTNKNPIKIKSEKSPTETRIESLREERNFFVTKKK